jgi:hypothetical protein
MELQQAMQQAPHSPACSACWIAPNINRRNFASWPTRPVEHTRNDHENAHPSYVPLLLCLCIGQALADTPINLTP